MKPYCEWSTDLRGLPQRPFELMCVRCGAIRPTLRIPIFRVDAITRSFGWFIEKAFMQHARVK